MPVIRGRSGRGEFQAEGAAFAGGGVDLDLAAVDLGDVFDDREAEAGAAHFAAAAAVDAVEAFEDAGEVVLGDADAVVGDLDGDRLAVGTGADVDAAAVGGVLAGVVDQVGDRAL